MSEDISGDLLSAARALVRLAGGTPVSETILGALHEAAVALAAQAPVTQSVDFTVDPARRTYLLDATGTTVVATLPLAASCAGVRVTIIRTDVDDGGGATVATSGGDTVNHHTLPSPLTSFDLLLRAAYTLLSDGGAAWWVVATTDNNFLTS